MQFSGPNASHSAPPTWPDPPTISTRPRGTAVASLGRRTLRNGAASSLGDMTGVTPSGTGHCTLKSGSNGCVSAWESRGREGSKDQQVTHTHTDREQHPGQRHTHTRTRREQHPKRTPPTNT